MSVLNSDGVYTDNARLLADKVRDSLLKIIPEALMDMNPEEILYIIYQEADTLIACERLRKKNVQIMDQ